MFAVSASGKIKLALREDCSRSRRSRFGLAGIFRSLDLDKVSF